jgi:hypothetical protein
MDKPIYTKKIHIYYWKTQGLIGVFLSKCARQLLGYLGFQKFQKFFKNALHSNFDLNEGGVRLWMG